MTSASTSSARSQFWPNLALTLPFLLLYWLNLAHHQLWFDEINAWGIAAAAPTLSRLFEYVHFEGHPWLWYVILWIPSRFTQNPLALKWVEGLFGTAIYLVLGLLSPFNRVQKLLVFLSYYVVFEYTVMSRMYSVMFLMALLYVYRRTRQPQAVVGNVLLLGLVASTDMTGVLLSGALLLEYAYTLYSGHRGTPWNPGEKQRATLAVLLYTALLAFAVESLIPAKAISWQASGKIGSEALKSRRLAQAVGNMVASPWWPINRHFPQIFWATDVADAKWLLLLIPFVLYAYWRIFERQRNLQLLMALTLAFGGLFADVVYTGRVRHWGIIVVSFLLALWMQQAAKLQAGQPNRWCSWAYALMSLGALAGVTATASSWTHDFSQAGITAAWIQANEPLNVPMVGEWDLNFASMGEHLQRPMYFMECDCTDTFKLFARARDEFNPAETPARLKLAMQHFNTDHLLLVNFRRMTPEGYARLTAAHLTATPLKTFEGSEDDHENFYLYTITRQDSPGVASLQEILPAGDDAR